MSLEIVRTVHELRAKVRAWHKEGLRVGLVPTMGALHAGHMSLVTAAQSEGCDRIILSIFVNPKQFGPNEDLAAYPRQEAIDAALADQHGVHVIYAPTVTEMYPTGFETKVSVAGLTDVLCGTARPGHFDGVATVVTKLLTQSWADIAFFGEKDFQQLTLIRRLAHDLDLETEIKGVPTQREPDGLALSSRNAYLTEELRQVAPRLNEALQAVAQAYRAGDDIVQAQKQAQSELLAAGFLAVDYLEVRRTDDLSLVTEAHPSDSVRVFGAAYLGKARLIDNIAV